SGSSRQRIIIDELLSNLPQGLFLAHPFLLRVEIEEGNLSHEVSILDDLLQALVERGVLGHVKISDHITDFRGKLFRLTTDIAHYRSLSDVQIFSLHSQVLNGGEFACLDKGPDRHSSLSILNSLQASFDSGFLGWLVCSSPELGFQPHLLMHR